MSVYNPMYIYSKLSIEAHQYRFFFKKKKKERKEKNSFICVTTLVDASKAVLRIEKVDSVKVPYKLRRGRQSRREQDLEISVQCQLMRERKERYS